MMKTLIAEVFLNLNLTKKKNNGNNLSVIAKSILISFNHYKYVNGDYGKITLYSV